MKKLFMMVFMFVFLMAGKSFAQMGNDFPSPGFNANFPPYNQPMIPGATPGHNYAYGNAWGPQTVWGVRTGDIVTFQIVMDWWGFASMSLSPMSDQGNDFRYLHGSSNVDPWSQWVQPGIGYFCFRCSWQFTATEPNPNLRLEFLGSDQFAAHIEIGEIIPAPIQPPPGGVQVQPLVASWNKSMASDLANVGRVVATALTGGTVFACGTALWTQCAILAGAGVATSFATLQFERIANDPWDPDYQSVYEMGIEQQEIDNYAWMCPMVEIYDGGGGLTQMCPWLVYYELAMNAAAKAVAVTADRYYSCQLVNDPCQWVQRDYGIWYQHLLGEYMFWTGVYYKTIADFHAADGYYDDSDSFGHMKWIGILYEAYSPYFSGAY